MVSLDVLLLPVIPTPRSLETWPLHTHTHTPPQPHPHQHSHTHTHTHSPHPLPHPAEPVTTKASPAPNPPSLSLQLLNTSNNSPSMVLFLPWTMPVTMGTTHPSNTNIVADSWVVTSLTFPLITRQMTGTAFGSMPSHNSRVIKLEEWKWGWTTA